MARLHLPIDDAPVDHVYVVQLGVSHTLILPQHLPRYSLYDFSAPGSP